MDPRGGPSRSRTYYLLIAIWACSLIILFGLCYISTRPMGLMNPYLIPRRSFSNSSNLTNYTTSYGHPDSNQKTTLIEWANVSMLWISITFMYFLNKRLENTVSESRYYTCLFFNFVFIGVACFSCVSYWMELPGCNASPEPITGPSGSFFNQCNSDDWCGVYGEKVPQCPNYQGDITWSTPVLPYQLKKRPAFIGGLIISMFNILLGIVVFIASNISNWQLNNPSAPLLEVAVDGPLSEDYKSSPPGGFNNDPLREHGD